jgi:hypothetical protein
MGYRSDVKYVILFNTDEQRQAFKLEAMLVAADIESGLDVINNDWEYKIDLHDADYPYQIRVHYEDVKWYESTPWVDMQEKLMKLARDGYEGAFVFLRLGEEDDDVEQQSGAHSEDIHIYVDNYIELTRKSNFV